MPPDFDTNMVQLQNYLNSWVSDRPVSHWGVAALTKPLSFEFYQTWIEQGYHSTMSYLKDHMPMKERPQLLGSKLSSALVFAFPYSPHPAGQEFPLKQARVALYAQGDDYHFWIKDHLRSLANDLKKIFPEEEFMVFTDSAPVMERDLGYRAGLGWIGKNTCLIDPKKGSLFFIAEILTSLPLESKTELTHDFCGNCRACIEICPTQAIPEPRKVDAKKCISFLTIESREVPPLELREKMGDWLFGCDLCQTICPWNQKVFKNRITLDTRPLRTPDSLKDLVKELRLILNSSGKALTKLFQGTPLQRAGPFGLKRNALIVIGNMKLTELKAEVEIFLRHEKLSELAEWTYSRI